MQVLRGALRVRVPPGGVLVSETKYARDKILRIDEKDRMVLYRAIMRSIQIVSSQTQMPDVVRLPELHALRSLLDQVEEL